MATVAPSIRSTTSPFRSPARAAGVSGAMSPMRVVRDGTPPRKTTQKTRMAKTRFPTGPAATIAIFTQTGFCWKERASCSGGTSSPSLSPTSFTYPPRGTAESRYSVSPRRKPASFGPNPNENLVTPTPSFRATMKWPNSWTKMRMPRTTMNERK